MSDYTDFMEEQFFAHHTDLQEECAWRAKWASLRREYPDWISREGKEVPITQMTDSHLDNLIAFLKRKNDGSKAIETWLNILQKERHYRDTASLEAELQAENEIIDQCF